MSTTPLVVGCYEMITATDVVKIEKIVKDSLSTHKFPCTETWSCMCDFILHSWTQIANLTLDPEKVWTWNRDRVWEGIVTVHTIVDISTAMLHKRIELRLEGRDHEFENIIVV